MASATARRAAPGRAAAAFDGPALPLPPIAAAPHGLAATMYHALTDPLWPEPDRFLPERFLGARRAAIPRSAHLPFGAGPRVCLGGVFALREAVLVLATLLRDLRFHTVPGREPRLGRRITLRPVGGLVLAVEKRR